jgi:Pro-kumamolisin, activation domain/Bacterial Ig-like domain (group 3)
MQGTFSRTARIFLIVLSIAVLSLSAFSQTSAQNRIVQAIENGKVLALPGTVHPLAQARYDQGPVDGSMKLQGMSLDIAPSASQKAALAALLKAQQDPSSPSYHQWLTPQQYGAEFGLTQADISKVTVWLQSQGFTVDKVSESRNAIWFSGTAALAEAAFHTQIHKYLVDGEMHFANAAAVSVPSALADSVIRVGGLNDFKLKQQLVRPVKANKNGVSPQFTSGLSGNHYIQPGDFAIIYDMNPLYSAKFTGSGVTIGVIGQTDIVMADITDFRNAASPTLPAYGSAGGPTFTNFLIPTSADPGLSPSDIGEADLDLEWSGGVGTNANIIYVNSTNVFDSLFYAIENQINSLTIPILTMSYAGCEAAFTAADISTAESAFQEASAQGQTIINSSGDSGAAACDDQSATVTTAVQGLAVNYPTSSPEVTGLGGSEFMGDGTAENPQTGSGTYWSANGSNDLVTSAKSYIPEMAWNDTTFDIANGGGLSAGGGGVSILFAKPTWQAGVPGIPADGHRDVPDVSIDASADHDGYLFCTEVVLESSSTGGATPSCTNGFRISDPGFSDDQGLSIVGGTSVSAPAFAGMLATIEQKLGTALGNIDPDLYTLASNSTTYASAFHDITVGNNIVPCTAGTPASAPAATQCPGSGQFGYSASTGYDQATGLGSVDGNNLATAFSTLAVTPGTTTTVTFSPSPVVVGAAVTLTATVAANSGTATPGGSVVFTVDGAAMAPVTLTAGVATAMTSFSTGGIHTIVAAYTPGTGDNFFASTGSTTIDVFATGSITTTTSVALNPSTTVAIGSSLVITATVMSNPLTGTLPGTVNFFAGTNLTTPLNASPVAISPGATGTGTAAYTVSNVQTSLGFVVGSTTITAHYTGTSAYAASTGTATITVTNPTITMTVANMTISGPSPGNTGTSAIAVTSMGGYAGTVNLTATAATLNASYMITPTAVTIASGATGMASISIQTVAASIKEGVGGNLKHSTPTSNSRAIAGAAAAFGCIFLLGIPGFRKKRWPMLTALLLLGALSAGLGCGGGGPSGASPAGTYTVTVTATDSVNNAVTVSTNFTVTIQ